MSIKELETAIMMLSNQELANLTMWLINYHEQVWDREIADDLELGNLDKILDEVDREYEAGLAESL